jgi:hypothetical protein
MKIPEGLNFRTKGFSGERVGYCLSVLNFALVPLHSHVTCENSGTLGCVSLIILVLTLVLSFIRLKGTSVEFLPSTLSFLAVVAHTLFAH